MLAVWLLEPTASASAQQEVSRADPLKAVMDRAVAAVATFERDFAAVVAEEHLLQRTTTRDLTNARREMYSDLLLVRLPGQDAWLPFRDVFEVDGRAVRDRDERLQKLFVDAPQTALSDARRISDESSRYNLGPVARTINVPTFGLMLLRPAYLKRFEFRKRGEERLANVMTWRVGFVERTPPTVVRTLKGDDVPLEGSLWIDPASGRVIKTLVKTIGTADPGSAFVNVSGVTLMWVEVTFAPNDTLGVWVPQRMLEWARAENRSEVSGDATYSKFRRFAVRTEETFKAPQKR